MPIRLGGISVLNPVVSAPKEFEASKRITENLKSLILSQEQNLENYNLKSLETAIESQKVTREIELIGKVSDVIKSLNQKTGKAVKLAQEKGASSWLTALPLQSMGYVLNKEQF